MRILHVEDEPIDIDLTRRVLLRADPATTIVNAATLAEARQRLDGSEDFDIVLADLGLPDGNGMELLAESGRRGRSLAIVMMTASGKPESAVAALRAGADDYVVKSIDRLEGLDATLRHVLQRRAERAAARIRPLRVLYAEHDPADFELTRRHLAGAAPHITLVPVAGAGRAVDAVLAGVRDGVPFDAVMLDYRLPGADALEAVKALRAVHGLDVPLVIVSGQGSEDVAARALHLGADDFLTKHAGYLHEVPATIEKVCRQAELLRERRQLAATSQRLDQVLAASPMLLFTLRGIAGGRLERSWSVGNLPQWLGYTEDEAKAEGWWEAHIHPDDQAAAVVDPVLLGPQPLVREYRFLDRSGRVRWMREELRLLEGSSGSWIDAIGMCQDITEQKWIEQLRESRLAVLDGVAGNVALPLVLGEIAVRLERLFPDMRVSVLLHDQVSHRLFTAAGPSLPDFYNAAVDGLEVREGNGSCGSAAALGQAVVVADIPSHPYWRPYVEIAARAGVRSCWSFPFKDDGGAVLGTFGIYHADSRAPHTQEIEVIGEFARLAGLAVERVRALEVLRQAAAVFENTSEGVMITDLAPRIVQVNRAFVQITGYSAEQALGRNPSLISSGRHDADFYRGVWRSIAETGNWRGEIWNRRSSGEVFPQILTISTVRGPDGKPARYVGVMTDISQIKQSEERLERLAHYDPLTGLPNRLMLQFRLEHALEVAARAQRLVAVLFVDVDRFKSINDGYGHPAGDEVLQVVAQRLAGRLREGDTLGRLGGDEFLVILENLPRAGAAAEVADAIMQLMREPIALSNGREVYVSLSIGISLSPEDGSTVSGLIEHADAAMYQAKENGRNNFKYYTAELTVAADKRLALDARMRRALANGEFVVFFQPQVDAASGRVDGCEALVRWLDPVQGMIPPARFIPLAEETGFIVDLGEWVLRTACRAATGWPARLGHAVTVSVNVSGRQLRNGEFVRTVAAVLAETGLAAARLRLELTESTLMAAGDEAAAMLGGLRDLGLSLAMDDFGTGHSSMKLLASFPIDELKVDIDFVRGIANDAKSRAIAVTIITLARELGLRVVAEGVETAAQLEFLAGHGCQTYQGYLCSPAISSEEFVALCGVRGSAQLEAGSAVRGPA